MRLDFMNSCSFEFNEQWSRLKAYANENGIRIIGDIPIYVAFDGADSWAHPELFQFDEECLPKAWPAAHRMHFQQQASFGEIRCMTGDIIRKIITAGGSSVWNTA